MWILSGELSLLIFLKIPMLILLGFSLKRSVISRRFRINSLKVLSQLQGWLWPESEVLMTQSERVVRYIRHINVNKCLNIYGVLDFLKLGLNPCSHEARVGADG